MKFSIYLAILLVHFSLCQIQLGDDEFYASYGKIFHKLKAHNGANYELQNQLDKLRVLENDKLQEDRLTSCTDYANTKKTGNSTIFFQDVATDIGISHVHRYEKPLRPGCQFDFVFPGNHQNTTARMQGELCIIEALTGGAAVGDYDGDGWEDIFFTLYHSRSILYKNNGDGTFTDVTKSVNVGPEKYGSGATWVDIDADGDLDLYVTTAGDIRHYLYVNQGRYFTEEGIERGLSLMFENKRKIAGMTPNVGDFDMDGYLDIYVAEWNYKGNIGERSASRLMKNLGKTKPGYFLDVTDEAKVNMDSEWNFFKNKYTGGTFVFGASFTDFNNDGWTDLLITGDFGQSRLFWNNKDGTFTKCSRECNFGMFNDAMGTAIGDMNQDGLMDIFFSAIYWTNETCHIASCAFGVVGNAFYENQGNKTFLEKSDKLGIKNSYWGWGSSFLDYDNDCRLDLVVTNGMDTPSTTLEDHYNKRNSQLFHNEGNDIRMVDKATESGIHFNGLGRGLLVFDYDKDGDEDIVIVANVGPPMFYKNMKGNEKNWLRVQVKHRCQGENSKLCDSYGAIVKVSTSDGMTQTHFVGSKSHFFGQSELSSHFGLGTFTSVDKVEVSWPTKNKTFIMKKVAANQNLKIVQPESFGTIITENLSQECHHLKIEEITQQPTIGKISINSDGETVSYNPKTSDLFNAGVQTFKYRVTVLPEMKNKTDNVATAVLDFRVAPEIFGPCKNGKLVFPVKVVKDEGRCFSGDFNNENFTSWGASKGNLLRLSGHAYADNIAEPAGACSHLQKAKAKCPYPNELSGVGSNRPSPRLISNEIMAQTKDVPSKRNLSSLIMHWGQYLSHDIDHTSMLPRFENQYYQNQVWMPITVPKGDVHFDPFNTGKETIAFVRSTYNRCTGKYPGKIPREHPNLLSSFIDASMVYGVSKERCNQLREFKDGKMKMQPNGLLPRNEMMLKNENPLNRPKEQLHVAGDIRANIQIGLLSLHTLFVREHNRLAEEYKKKNPEAKDEEIFQEARRWVIAETQAIVFNEYLPALLGGNDVIPKYSGYNNSVNPGVSTEFSTAAFRYGHSEVSSFIFRIGKDGAPITEGHALLREVYFQPTRIEKEGGIEPILRGAIAFPSQNIDLLMVDEMRNKLFTTGAKTPGKSSGFDLASINIQRGRDHGLPDFNTVRKKIGLKAYSTFNEITKDAQTAEKLETLYKDINNIDLWVGGLAEDHFESSSLGETFHKIILDQFVRIRDGDRFWYQNSMTQEEVHMVDQLTLQKIIQMNTEYKDCSKNVFFSTDCCANVKNHQCLPKRSNLEKFYYEKEQLEERNEQQDNAILALMIITVLLAIVLLFMIVLILFSRRCKRNSSFVSPKDKNLSKIQLGITNDAAKDISN